MIVYCKHRDILRTLDDFIDCDICFMDVDDGDGCCKTLTIVNGGYVEGYVSIKSLSELESNEIHKNLIKQYLRKRKLERL